jgi:hypothetical protein
MLIKFIAHGCKSYFSDKSNIFDFLIVFLSTGDVVFFFYESFHDQDNIAEEN